MSPRLQAITIVANHYHVSRGLTPVAAERTALRRVREWSPHSVARFLALVHATAAQANREAA